ncbi:Ester hydrolase [Paramyrothecium foliicola]|nr:Ester hydrolase [Paramyrothecium foliicola]
MKTHSFTLSPPSLDELAATLKAPLAANYKESSVTVVQCPDLRNAPFGLSTEGLAGDEKIADVGGQPNLFPRPRLDSKWSLLEIAKSMDMGSGKGSLLGAGAGPFHVVGQNSEMCADLSWQSEAFGGLLDQSRVIRVDPEEGAVAVDLCVSNACGLMFNLFGSKGDAGPVLRITAKGRKGSEKSFTECIQKALAAAYSDANAVSLGGVVLHKSGKVLYHVMPDFPKEPELPFRDREEVSKWLTYHNYDGPIVCMSVLHSADPHHLDLRMEHTHGFSTEAAEEGGHYHYDLDEQLGTVEYEAYFNTAKTLYRVDRPDVLS